jgi:spermidine synthase
MRVFEETLHPAWRHGLAVDEVLFEHRTEHQHLVIFRNALFGRVMALDGLIQTTEGDEFIYHEMLAHTPILAHGRAERVLIVGGGDGGMLREVTRHASVRHVVQVEIDRAVVDLCREYLPNHSAGAYDDPRLELVIGEGMDYVRHSAERFDVIIADSTDPVGPGEGLFRQDFYAACRQRLKPGGVLVTQNGVPFTQRDELANTARRLQSVFADRHFYTAAIPSYVGGVMAFAWASDDPELHFTPLEVLEQRFRGSGITTRYYTPEVPQAAFALPRFLLDTIDK